MRVIFQHLRRLVAVEQRRTSSDGDLVYRYLEHQDEAAFACLVERHGPMVLNVCRRILHDEHAAEDGLQATFLVLARKMGSLRRWDSVGGWLYRIAYRLALKLRQQRVQQRDVERRAAAALLATTPSEARTWVDLEPVLDEELQQLPEKYRTPLLLCCLQGKSRAEAAQELGWKEGAVKIRLERGRDLLRQRLARRGVALSTAFLANFVSTGLASAALPLRLAAQTTQVSLAFATGQTTGLSAGALALAQTVLQQMMWAKLQMMGMLLLISVLGLGWWATRSTPEPPPSVTETPPPVVAVVQPTPTPPPVQQANVGPNKIPPTRPATKTLVGTLQELDLENETLTLRRDEATTFGLRLTPNTEVIVDGKLSTVAALKLNWRMQVEFVPEENTIERLQVEGPSVRGRVLAVDPENGSVTLAIPQQEGKGRTFFTASDFVQWEILQVDQEVELHLSVDRRTVVRVSAIER